MMFPKYTVVLGAAFATASLSIGAIAQHNHSGDAPYAGLQEREIKSLSESDVADIQAGRG